MSRKVRFQRVDQSRWRVGRERSLALPARECGAVSFIQRIGSALQLNVHFHVLFPTGDDRAQARRGAERGVHGRIPARAVHGRVLRDQGVRPVVLGGAFGRGAGNGGDGDRALPRIHRDRVRHSRERTPSAPTLQWSDVAEFGYRAMQKGKRVAIPGWMNGIGAWTVPFSPRGMVLKITRRMNEAE